MRENKFKWIDIHSHILPDTDNGAVDLNQTIAMLEMANQANITSIIATPHYGVGCRNPEPKDLYKKLELVRRQAKIINKDLTIALGNELYYSEDIIGDLRKEKALTLAGTRYVLVKFPDTESYEDIKTGIHRLLMYGYLPILSQVETYNCLQGEYEKIHDLIKLGAYMQMTISSLSGGLGNKEGYYAKKLLDYGLTHMFGTDSHSVTGKSEKIKQGISTVQKRYQDSFLADLFTGNAIKLLQNKYI
ncbi:MAG: Protein-tyrosine-phosphatase [Anaerocolumna sp.]|jgi:protein-tyrosine phosphatase|nr:Protein-tyrosine-phosphatase [Anaerocolumna sp.]